MSKCVYLYFLAQVSGKILDFSASCLYTGNGDRIWIGAKFAWPTFHALSTYPLKKQRESYALWAIFAYKWVDLCFVRRKFRQFQWYSYALQAWQRSLFAQGKGEYLHRGASHERWMHRYLFWHCRTGVGQSVCPANKQSESWNNLPAYFSDMAKKGHRLLAALHERAIYDFCWAWKSKLFPKGKMWKNSPGYRFY